MERLNKTNVEKLERLPNTFYVIFGMLKKTGMDPKEAKLYASNYQYPQVADDIIGMIGHMLHRRSNPKRSNKKPPQTPAS